MTDIIQQAEAAETKVAQTISTAWADIKAGVKYLETEGEKVINWVDTNVPGAQQAIQAFVIEADQDAAALAKAAANGLETAITAGGQDVETFIANLLQATNLTGAANGAAGKLSTASVGLLQTLLGQMVNVGLAKVLAAFAPAVA